MITFKVPTIKRNPNVHALIDADCVAYWASATANELPLNIALRQVDLRMNQILDECKAGKYTGYLTGLNNFRDEVATLQRYKGNRYDELGRRIVPQPVWLQECRDYLEQKWGCIVTPQQEADDALSIHRNTVTDDASYIISSIDKDLRINQGMHHDMNSGEMYCTEGIGELYFTGNKLRGSGIKFFYAQLLMGDTADWIKGLPKVTQEMKDTYPDIRKGGCGQKTAWIILKDCSTEEELHNAVWFCYKSFWMHNSYKHWANKNKVFKAGIETAQKQYIEQGRLLWMRQQKKELWKPKYQLK